MTRLENIRRYYLLKMKCLFFVVTLLVVGVSMVGCNAEPAAIPNYKMDVVDTADAFDTLYVQYSPNYPPTANVIPSDEEGASNPDYEPGEDYMVDAPYVPSCLPVVPVKLDDAECASDCIEFTQEQRRLWTVEELGAIIVATGIFWDEWWYTTGRFSYFNLGSWKDNQDSIYVELLPSSGFGSLCDIRSYLLHYYTEAWVDSMLSAEFPPFIEHNNALFVHVARKCSSYPDWETATHVITYQSDILALVESTVFYWSPEVNKGHDVTSSFIFINGRIDRSSRCL